MVSHGRHVGMVSEAYTPDIYGTDAEDLRALANRSDLLCDALRLLHVASDDARIGAQVDQGFGLDAADGACSSCHEHDLVVWDTKPRVSSQRCDAMSIVKTEAPCSPKSPSLQTLLRNSDRSTAIFVQFQSFVTSYHKEGTIGLLMNKTFTLSLSVCNEMGHCLSECLCRGSGGATAACTPDTNCTTKHLVGSTTLPRLTRGALSASPGALDRLLSDC